MKPLVTRCGGAFLVVLGLACATMQRPDVRTATPTPFGNCSIVADRVSVHTEGDAEIAEYAGQIVVTCPGQGRVVFSNLTITRHRSGEIEMAADSAELK